MNVDYSCYEGKRDHRQGATPCCRAAGWSSTTGEYLGAAGHGRFLRRDTCQYLR